MGKMPFFSLPLDSEQGRAGEGAADRRRRRSPARWGAAAARGEGGRKGALESLIPHFTLDYGGLWRWLRGGRRRTAAAQAEAVTAAAVEGEGGRDGQLGVVVAE